MTALAEPAALPLDPKVAVEKYQQTTEAVADALAHMHTAVSAAEAELAIVRYHHVHRLSHLAAAG